MPLKKVRLLLDPHSYHYLCLRAARRYQKNKTVDICTRNKLPFRKSTVELRLLQIKRDQDAFWTLLM